MTDPASMRREYARGVLDESTVPTTWLELFTAWFAEAETALTYTEVNAMQLATVDAAGNPAVRTVLAKGVHDGGVEFYTNYQSDKGCQLERHPYAAVVFAWVPIERQVRLSGPVHRVSRERTEQYFASRPRGAQLGAWASPQSTSIASRAELDGLRERTEQRFAGRAIPAPPHWGGYLITPQMVEFWQGRPDRLHDRLRYRLQDGQWRRERLAP